MSKLWDLIQTHIDDTGVREAELARRMGSSPQTLNSWKNRGLKALPERRLLQAVGEQTRTPYETVLDAALFDIGYSSETGNGQPTNVIAAAELVALSFKADDAEVAARQADGFDNSDQISEVVSALDDLVDAVYELTRAAQNIAIEGVGGRDTLAHLKDQELEANRRRRRLKPAAPETDPIGPHVSSEGSFTAPQSAGDDAMLRAARRTRSAPSDRRT